jgi:hypothetical protein
MTTPVNNQLLRALGIDTCNLEEDFGPYLSRLPPNMIITYIDGNNPSSDIKYLVIPQHKSIEPRHGTIKPIINEFGEAVFENEGFYRATISDIISYRGNIRANPKQCTSQAVFVIISNDQILYEGGLVYAGTNVCGCYLSKSVTFTNPTVPPSFMHFGSMHSGVLLSKSEGVTTFDKLTDIKKFIQHLSDFNHISVRDVKTNESGDIENILK